MVDVRPWPKAFRPPPLPEQQQTEQQPTDGSDPPEQAQQAQQPRCFYFMGLSKKKVCEGGSARQAQLALPGHVRLTASLSTSAPQPRALVCFPGPVPTCLWAPDAVLLPPMLAAAAPSAG